MVSPLSQLDELTSRVSQLEARLQRGRRASVSLLLLAVSVIGLGMTQDPQPTDTVADSLQARRIEILDADGRGRLFLTTDGLIVANIEGKTRIRLGLTPGSEEASLSLNSERGAENGFGSMSGFRVMVPSNEHSTLGGMSDPKCVMWGPITNMPWSDAGPLTSHSKYSSFSPHHWQMGVNGKGEIGSEKNWIASVQSRVRLPDSGVVSVDTFSAELELRRFGGGARAVLSASNQLDTGSQFFLLNKTGEKVITMWPDEYGNGRVGIWNRKGTGQVISPGN